MTYYREMSITRALAAGRGIAIGKWKGLRGLYSGEPEYLVELAGMAPDGPGLEIGIRHGHSLLLWAKVREGRGSATGIELVDRPRMRKNISKSGLDVNVVIGDSATVPIGLEEVAFLFIDGDHRRTGFKADLARFVSLVMPGGIVAFHDYGHPVGRYAEFAVTKYVKRWHETAGWKRLRRVHYLIAFQRPL